MQIRLTTTVGAAALLLAPVAWLAGDHAVMGFEHDALGREGSALDGSAKGQVASSHGAPALEWAAAFGLTDAAVLQATTVGHFHDSDGDSLPDSLEWVLATDPLSADSDADGFGDFEETVHFTYALDSRDTPVLDHGMRPVVTTEPLTNGSTRVWLHLVFQFVGGVTPSTVVQQFNPWVDLGGGRIPFNLLGNSTPLLTVAPRANGSAVVMLSTDVGPAANLMANLPLTVGADALLGSKAVSSGVHLAVKDGAILSMTPKLFYGKDHLFAVRSTQQPRNKPNPFQGANKVCVMDILPIGSGPSGILYEVSDARCETAHGLNCGAECAQMLGWTFTLPSGAPAITGG